MKNKKIFKKGGAKSRYPDKKGFQAVYDMLASPNSTLSILTTSSLKGFMLKLDVIDGEAAYRTDSNIPITSYILKFVVISNENISERLESYNNKTKESEKHNDFIEEAKLQQSIWMSSIEQIQHEICPSVANLAIFDNNGARILLDDLFNMYNLPELKELTDLFKYLNRQLTGTRGLGILTMPNIVGSQTLYRFYNSPGVSNEVKINVKSQLASQVIILFLYLCVIHFDLHSNNSLVFFNSITNNYETRIIDFGRVSDICEFSKTDYINKVHKPRINNQLNSLFEELKLRITTDKEKKDFVKKVLDYIYKFDLDIHGGTAQMKWIDEIKNNSNNCLKVFQYLDNIIFSGKPATFTPEKLDKYKYKGVIQDLNNPDNYIQKVDDLYVSSEGDFSSYHSSQSSNISSQEELHENQLTRLPSVSSQSSVSSQKSRSPSLVFNLVNPNPTYREQEFDDRLAQVPVTPVASIGTFSAGPTPINSSIDSNAFSSTSSVKTFTPGLTPAISSIPSNVFEQRKKIRPGEEKGGKRSKKIKNKKGKKRVTKKRKYRSK